MEEEESNTNTSSKCTPKTKSFRERRERAYTYHHHHHHHHHHHLHHHLLPNPYTFGYGFGFGYQNFPALLPLPPTIPLQLTVNSPFPQNHTFSHKSHLRRSLCKQTNPSLATSSDYNVQDFSLGPGGKEIKKPAIMPCDKRGNGRKVLEAKPTPYAIARRPDCGGVEGKAITLLANHYLVKFIPSQKIFHYNVDISPIPSKDIAHRIKHKLVEQHSHLLSCSNPVFDGRATIYSPVEFQENRFEFFISLPISVAKEKVGLIQKKESKIFKVNIKLVSKLDGKALSSFLDKDDDSTPLPQEYIHALDVVLREGPTEKCIPSGRSFFSSLMGGAKEIGGGAIAYRGFFQSLRPTQQGLSLNVDFSVTAFHESIGVIPYLHKRFDFIHDICQRKTRSLTIEERKEVEKALKNMRIFVCHRETVQRYKVHSLTDEDTENLWFPDRDGRNLRLLDYFKDHYDYDIQFRNLPCLQISRRKACYLPMELCVICEGQKFLGKLSDDQTAKLLKIGCQRPIERKLIIDRVMEGPAGPTSGNGAKEFKLQIAKEMTMLKGRILQPPKLKLGHGGNVRNLTPNRSDRQWNLRDSHVFEGARIERWALISFGGSSDEKSSVSRFVNQLSQRCEQLGIFLHKNTIISPLFEPMNVLANAKALESKLKKIHKACFSNLQLLICVMEKKHKGYADLKRIAETGIGIVSQCCLYSNLGKLTSQFLANIALKINAKVGGCTVALYNSLPSQMPRLFKLNEPVIFMGADVTHPHPLDDSSPSIAAVVGSVNWPSANKYVSRMRSQTHRQEIIQDLATMVGEILDDFYEENSQLPSRIIFFRDGVSETQFNKVLQDELESIRAACSNCSKIPNYNPPITFLVVQKRHHTRLFPFESEPSNQDQSSDENIRPGTVVDTTITHPREFDFYLCSHWGLKGTSRPIHYHVLFDESKFTSDEVQKLVYNLCYTFVRCTKPISLVPPAYYAHLAAYRGRLYIDRSDSIGSTISRSSPPEAVALPKLSENIRKLMFYC